MRKHATMQSGLSKRTCLPIPKSSAPSLKPDTLYQIVIAALLVSRDYEKKLRVLSKLS